MSPRLTTLGSTALLFREGYAPTSPLRGKPLAVLCRLAFASRRQLSRDTLAEEIWGDLPPTRARAQLRTALWQIRAKLGDQAIEDEDDLVTLHHSVPSDRAEFEEALQSRDRSRAINLYAGDFLAGLSVPSAQGFDEWVDIERRMLRQLFAATVEGEVTTLLDIGRFRESITLAQRLREIEPFSQAAWRLLIRSHVVAGNQDAARAVARACEDFLQRERLPMEAETAAAIRGASRVVSPSTEASPGLTPDLVAREREFQALLRQLESSRRSGGRTVRIIGSPGIGKTRLISDFARTAESRGHFTVVVTGARTTNRVPYSGLARLVDGLAQLPGALGVADAVAATLLDLNPSLASIYRKGAGVAPSPIDVGRLRLTALIDLVRAVCAEKPLVIIVDDAQWLDDDSRAAIESAAEISVTSAALFVIAERELSATQVLARTDEMVTLTPFSQDECESLVSSLAAAPNGTWLVPWLASLHNASGGVPLRVLDLIMLALETQRVRIEQSTWLCQDPAALIELTERGAPRAARFARLTADARRVATLCACAKEVLEPDVVCEVLEINPTALDVACEELARHGMGRLVGGKVSLDHEEYAETARELQAPDARVDALKRLATAMMEKDDRESARRAFAFAESAGDEALASKAAKRFLKIARRAAPHRTTIELLAELTGVGDKGQRFERFSAELDVQRRWSKAAWGLAAAGIVAAIVAVAAAKPTFDPDAILSVQLRDDADGWYEATLPIETDRWRAGDPLVVDASQARLIMRGPAHGLVRSHEANARWLVQQPHERPTLDDIVLIDQSGKQRTVVADSGDDTGAAWSPDNRFAVYTTSRWQHRESADLARFDVQTGTVTRLGGGPGELSATGIASDGSGVVYTRAFDGRSRVEVCLLEFDQAQPICKPIPRGTELSSRGAFIPALGIVTAQRNIARKASHIIAWNVEANEERELLFCPGTIQSEVLSSVIVCKYQPSGQLYAAPLFAPNAWRPIIIKDAGGKTVNTISVMDLEPKGLIKDIEVYGAKTPMVGVAHHLRVVALSDRGESLAVRRPKWELIKGAGTIDSDGTLVASDSGKMLVRATASNGLADTIELSAKPRSSAIIFDEPWDQGWSERWRPFGVPFPQVLEAPNGGAFWNAGDGSYSSGAYTTHRFLTFAGLTLDADVEVPSTTSGEQMLRIALVGADDSTSKATWDHKTGYYPGPGYQATCDFEYPLGLAGPEFGLWYNAGGVRADATPAMRSGKRFHVHIQVLPDGRCSVGVDGRAPTAAAKDQAWPPTRVVIYGSSVGKKVLVHHLTLRRGY